MTDIYLITGFLGAGKTTLMKNLMQIFRDGKTAIIVNEFGQEGVDGSILAAEGMVIEEIIDGSIFCVCRSDKFIEAILKTAKLNVDCLIVESSGLADPFGMHEVMGIINKLSPGNFHYSGSICVVDVKNFHKIYGFAPAIKQQVQGADLLLINKTDISTAAEIGKVEETLRQLNKHAEIIKTSFARLPDSGPVLALKWSAPDMKGVIIKKTLGVSKFVLKFGSVPLEQLTAWLREWAGKVYRLKGFCAMNDHEYFIQAVGGDIRVSEFRRQEKENFLVVLAPAYDSLKTEIRESWFRYFKTDLEFVPPISK